jgi:GNAT superfamily N-acetyltransferase
VVADPAVRLRLATHADIPAMQRIRLAVRENVLSDPSRVTDADVAEHLETLGRGWVAERGDEIVGFAFGRTSDGEIWALFVDPDHEGLGAGALLHDTMVAWLFAQGLKRLTLGTGRGTRAEGFYLRRGWQLTGDGAGDEVRMQLLA